MTAMTDKSGYRPTESKFKGGAREMYVTYDLEQATRGRGTAKYPKVKRVYIAGDVTGWHSGLVRKRTGRETRGVCIEYEQRRSGYRRKAFTAHRGRTPHPVAPAAVAPAAQRFAQVVEVPPRARHVRFYAAHADLPARYREALQRVR